MRFIKKPIAIEAIQWTGSNLSEILNFCEKKAELDIDNLKESCLIIYTLEGQHVASLGDWIIQGVKGEFYPCKPDIFKMTYDKEEI